MTAQAPEKRWFHLSGDLSLGHVLTLVGFFVAGLVFVMRTEASVASNAHAIALQARTDERTIALIERLNDDISGVEKQIVLLTEQIRALAVRVDAFAAVGSRWSAEQQKPYAETVDRRFQVIEGRVDRLEREK